MKQNPNFNGLNYYSEVIRNYFREVRGKQKSPMINEVKKEALNDEIMYYIMFFSIGLIGVFMIGVYIINFILK